MSEKQTILIIENDKAISNFISRALTASDYRAIPAVTGREEVIFSPEDSVKVGAQVVARANEMLAKASAPKLPQELKQTTAGALLDKVVTGASALLSGTGMLTLSQEIRPIRGGFILQADGVELNCAFDTLVRLARPELERQVAQILFEE